MRMGALMAMDNLEQAVHEANLWKARKEQLILDCANLGWPYQRIADACGLSYQAVAQRISRARKAAREAT